MEIVPLVLPVYGEIFEQRGERKNFSTRIALIDADKMKYLVAHSMYGKIVEEGLPYSISMLNETINFYLDRDIFNNFEAKSYIFCFSAPSKQVFRNHIAQESEYKGNRGKSEDKTFYDQKYEDMAYVYEYINSRYQALLVKDLEADDLLSMLQNEHTFIYSNDKDLKQVPGFHFDLQRRVLYYVSEEEGMQMLLKQCLTGDTTDSIPGLKGIGPVKAEKICGDQEPNQMFLSVINEYISKHGLLHGIDTFVEMWSLVCMKLDRGDYFKTKYASVFNVLKALTDDQDGGEE